MRLGHYAGGRVVWVEHPDRNARPYPIPNGLVSIGEHITKLKAQGDKNGMNEMLEAWVQVKAEVGTNA